MKKEVDAFMIELYFYPSKNLLFNSHMHTIGLNLVRSVSYIIFITDIVVGVLSSSAIMLLATKYGEKTTFSSINCKWRKKV